jgi:MoxR-like ATPase
MTYRKFFDPDAPNPSKLPRVPEQPGDLRDGSKYEYTDKIVFTVNVALSAGRPLLVSGSPGTGKSSLPASVAKKNRWRYYEYTVTSRSEARDLLWTFDAVRRIGDAQAEKLQADHMYVEPGPLWWALDRNSALRRGAPEEPGVDFPPEHMATDPSPRRGAHAVVLVDEIDKADPDLPNDMLEVLGSRRFEVAETRKRVTGELAPFVVITTNDERDLPAAFVRRCVRLNLPDPTQQRLEQIGAAHLGDRLSPTLITEAAKKTLALGEEAGSRNLRRPSTAEFLDLLWACMHMNVRDAAHEDWESLARATLWKEEARPASGGRG